jgi:dynein regulatory complex protein 1
METDIQNILKCYEDMKALFQLNTEKLDYNLKILKEKNEESKKIEAEKKKKDNELTEQLRNLNRKYWENDDLSKKENKMLTSKYKQIT